MQFKKGGKKKKNKIKVFGDHKYWGVKRETANLFIISS